MTSTNNTCPICLRSFAHINGLRSHTGLAHKNKDFHGPPMECVVDGCGTVIREKKDGNRKLGFCRKHEARWERHGDPTITLTHVDKPRPKCAVEACTKQATSRLKSEEPLCTTHYGRFSRLGDPRAEVHKRAEADNGFGSYVQISVDGRKVAEHRYVMEQRIGRPLQPYEHVHHINGVRNDNRPENLELWLVHHPAGQRMIDKVEWAHELLEEYQDAYDRQILTIDVYDNEGVLEIQVQGKATTL